MSSTTVRSGETIQTKYNLTSLGYPRISWMWFCSNQAPVYGTSVQLESYLSLNINFNNKSIGCRCRGTSLNFYVAYDEFSDVVEFTIFCFAYFKTNGCKRRGRCRPCLFDIPGEKPRLFLELELWKPNASLQQSGTN